MSVESCVQDNLLYIIPLGSLLGVSVISNLFCLAYYHRVKKRQRRNTNLDNTLETQSIEVIEPSIKSTGLPKWVLESYEKKV